MSIFLTTVADGASIWALAAVSRGGVGWGVAETTSPATAMQARLAQLDREIEERSAERAILREALAALEQLSLTGPNQTGYNQSMPDHELSSAGKRIRSKRAPMSAQAKRFLVEYAYPAGFSSLRDLAARMRKDAAERNKGRSKEDPDEDTNITHSHLSQMLTTDYAVSEARAERIRKLTRSTAKPDGYAVNRRNWRGLRVDEKGKV